MSNSWNLKIDKGSYLIGDLSLLKLVKGDVTGDAYRKLMGGWKRCECCGDRKGFELVPGVYIMDRVGDTIDPSWGDGYELECDEYGLWGDKIVLVDLGMLDPCVEQGHLGWNKDNMGIKGTNEYVKIDVDDSTSIWRGTEDIAESWNSRDYLWIPGFGKLS